ncbi:MAG: TolC family outer membrane protein [Silicimonas sp.]|nr:TolC family outer membrane protein [Silicimonas sp.]
MKRPNFLAGLAAAACIAASGPVGAETLTDALVASYRNSGLIAQNRAVLRAADEDVAQAVASLRPVFAYAVGSSYANNTVGDDFSGNLAVTGNMLLYDFGRTQLAIDAAKETVLATRAALVDIENTVLLNTVDAYMAVRRAQAFINLRQNNVRLLTEQLRATRDRFEVGEVTRTDVSLAEARLAAARSGLAAEQGGLARAQEQYKAVIGQYPANLAAPPSPPAIPGTEEAARSVARTENPQINQVQHQVKAVELIAEQAARGMYPSLNASGRAAIDDDGDDSLSLGLDLSGPSYQGGAIASAVRKAQAQKDQVRAQLYTTGLLVDQQVGNAYANLAVAIASIDASNRQVRAAQLALEGVREELQLGARTTLDVLDREQELLDAQTDLVSAQVDRYTAVYQVLDAMGLLTAERLGLNVPIYDPSAYYNAVKDAPGFGVSREGQRLDRVLKSIGKE